MHGCGVYEVNERPIYGRFYFGELVKEELAGCDENTSMLHAGIAEVAAAKARMFVNKPDGMVREERGPYNDPQHPYLYEDEDVWMAPGFVNQFYEVPDYWKTYVHEVDEERQMWLNSFYKAPLRIPMPAELEYWWSKDERPEFIILRKEPELDPEDPSKLVYTEDPVILHTKTGRIINFIEDEEHGVRLFWQPPLKEGEEVDPNKAEFLPLGFDEFYGRTGSTEKKGGILNQLITAVENVCNPVIDKLDKWVEEKKKASELKIKLIEKELEFVEAELCLEEAIEDMESELELKQKEEAKKVDMEDQDEKDTSYVSNDRDDTYSPEDEDEEDDEDDDDGAPTSFGSVIADQDSTKNGKGNKPRKSPFATTSLLFGSGGLVSTVPFKLQDSFLSWKNGRCATTVTPSSPQNSIGLVEPLNLVSFPRVPAKYKSLKAVGHKQVTSHKTNVRLSQLHSLSQVLSCSQSTMQRKRKHIGKQRSLGHKTQVAPEIEHRNHNLVHPFHHEQKGEGSWNVAWDVRPARWLHSSDSAWLLFGVCGCLAPLELELDSCGEYLEVNKCIDESFLGNGRCFEDIFPTKETTSLKYRVIGVPGDGRCLFRAVSYGACMKSGEEPDEKRQMKLADDLRARVVDELLKRRQETEWIIEGDFDMYVNSIQRPNAWGGEPELLMASHVLRVPISVYMIDRSSGDLVNIANYGHEYGKEESHIQVLFHGYGHYDVLEIFEDNLPAGIKDK
ncbi:Tic-like protein [Thalictrum thalictroides]|uniref:Ubiquitin thioesterase OTU n=1 Tax=Thalictrum thalictroides TaxID=46969 RepID=A0A7J6VRD2_THATH|nr:Tic-like protein [Thalictrum thalictroides]